MNAARDIILRLDLAPHPEGGHYRETWRAAARAGRRAAGSAIYYLLAAGEKSRWHRVDADEIWHFYAGAPLALTVASESAAVTRLLGRDLEAGELPQVVVPAGQWQTAESRGAWTLVGCTVSPAFEFSGLELAPPGFQP